jgi:hypothetical protein
MKVEIRSGDEWIILSPTIIIEVPGFVKRVASIFELFVFQHLLCSLILRSQ